MARTTYWLRAKANKAFKEVEIDKYIAAEKAAGCFSPRQKEGKTASCGFTNLKAGAVFTTGEVRREPENP